MDSPADGPRQLALFPELPIQTGRRDLEIVGPGHEVLDVEVVADLS